MEDAVSALAEVVSAVEIAHWPWSAHIDWQRPWLQSVLPAARKLPRLADLHAALNTCALAQQLCNAQGTALQFVPQAALPAGMAYESFIFSAASVPTRENLHDFFNALVWLSFPRIKQALNRLQSAQIVAHGIGQVRGAVRDGATLFDENAALLLVRDSAAGRAWVHALRQHDWPAVYQPRAFAELVKVALFGHALMEKLVCPYKAITAHAYVVWLGEDEAEALFAAKQADLYADVDARLAQHLQNNSLQPADFCHLPIAGIPGWWDGQDQEFYADATVFRPLRRSKEAS